MSLNLIKVNRPRRALPSRPQRAHSQWQYLFRAFAGRIAAGAVALSLAIASVVAFVSWQSQSSIAAHATEQPNTSNLAELAKQREASISEDAAAIAETNNETALANRQKQLANDSEAIMEEAQRLAKLSEFLWPTEGSVSASNGYGMRYHPILHRYRLHDGIDIGAPCGQEIYAAQSGVVVRTTNGYSGGSGNSVKIDHGEFNGINIQTAYLHMSKFVLSEGDQVEKGQLVGYVGNTGLSTGCHLHLTLYKDGRGTDPAEYVKKPAETVPAPDEAKIED